MADPDPIVLQLAEERTRRGLSQREVAELAGVTQSAVSEWETGAVVARVDSLRRHAAALGFRLRVELVPADGSVVPGVPALPSEAPGGGAGLAEGCPTCSPPRRETVGMVCRTCGTDYAPEGAGDLAAVALTTARGSGSSAVSPAPDTTPTIPDEAVRAFRGGYEAKDERLRPDVDPLKCDIDRLAIRAGLAAVRPHLLAPADMRYIGRCGNEREPDGEVCPADLYAAAGDVQTQCPTCGAWTGVASPGRSLFIRPPHRDLGPPIQGPDEPAYFASPEVDQ